MQPSEILALATDQLLASRHADGHWEGHLSSSALSTATAVGALALGRRAGAAAPGDAQLVARGLTWLCRHQNSDGGWGDTPSSPSNISTTLLVWSALAFAPPDDAAALASLRGAEGWIRSTAGGLDETRLAEAVDARYGRDRTFSVPILTMCALAGRLGGDEAGWRAIAQLPFELAAAPRRAFAWLRLPVVSYALPALVAMGLARHRRCPTRNPAARLVRNAATPRVLRILEGLQPSNGGFLEATPLTSFVAMSLVGADEATHPVAGRARQFIRASVRADGSWPIDTHLATWLTTLAVNALREADALARLDARELVRVREWIVEQQHTREHAYTGAAPGGWAWTPLAGGVPDADDTAGAVLALAALPPSDSSARAAVAGLEWLLSLQNRDGGIPTFCRGWGALPFDRSGADLTAHALRAWDAWLDTLDAGLQARVGRAQDRALHYLRSVQRPDGSFLPLWFGNQSAPAEANPTYGTARVVTALAALRRRRRREVDTMLSAACRWLRSAQHRDGGWGGDRDAPSSVEETGLAMGALADADAAGVPVDDAGASLLAACEWLDRATAGGERFDAAPIGLYFAKLWYSESLYPVLFAVDGLGRAVRQLAVGTGSSRQP